MSSPVSSPRADSPATITISFSTKFVKCATITALGIVTIGAVFAATVATGGLAIALFAALAAVGSAASFAAIAAAFSEKSVTIKDFFSKCIDNLGPALAAVVQVVAQTLFNALVQRCANKITGPTQIEVTHRY